MNRNRYDFVMIAMVVLFGVWGCESQRPTIPTGLSITKAQDISVYEGLPHQLYEKELLESEKKSKPTTNLGGYPFYRDPLNFKAEDQQELIRLLSDINSYVKHFPDKKCGGFHPDFAITWTIDGKHYTLLICFGCGEYEGDSAGTKTNNDIPEDVEKRLEDLLTPHQLNRPPKASPMG